MSAQIFIVDSFTDQPFKGNPAGVHLSDQPIAEAKMQSIAAELNLSETAFVVRESDSSHIIRYFSPLMEIPLCGHATLAASKIVFENFDVEQILFKTGQGGVELPIQKINQRIQMNFPVYELQPSSAPVALLSALGISSPNYAGYNVETNILMLEIDSCEQLQLLQPDFPALVNSHDSIHGVLLTAPGNGPYDFHSRYFWPWSGGEEDPVTGSTHTFMAKYWSTKLGKPVLQSFQASARSGSMEVELTDDDRLLIRGDAIVILEGTMRI